VIACATDSADATRRLAARVAELVGDGDLIVLAGDLGAGKTVFTQGFARALGVVAPVTSPTFTLANRYEGRIVVNHVDVYRLEGLEEARDLALPELLESGVTLVEWGDRIRGELPSDQLEVRIEFGEGDDDRVLQVRPAGASWRARRQRLAEALAEWTGGVPAP
jgi:tRNA threonylcarbamoyladenosine biosynthesis protein TsaE